MKTVLSRFSRAAREREAQEEAETRAVLASILAQPDFCIVDWEAEPLPAPPQPERRSLLKRLWALVARRA
jgi:hypothetical protein